MKKSFFKTIAISSLILMIAGSHSALAQNQKQVFHSKTQRRQAQSIKHSEGIISCRKQSKNATLRLSHSKAGRRKQQRVQVCQIKQPCIFEQNDTMLKVTHSKEHRRQQQRFQNLKKYCHSTNRE